MSTWLRLIAVTTAVLTLLGCERVQITSVMIVDKSHIAASKTTEYSILPLGDALWVVPIDETHKEKWYLIVDVHRSNGGQRREKIAVSRARYESVEIGQEYLGSLH